MSEGRISLSKLESDRDGWGTNWRAVITEESDGFKTIDRYWRGQFDHDENEHGEEGYITCHSDELDYAPELGQLIADEHNAIPVLIAIAKAALARQTALDQDRPVRVLEQCEKDLLEAIRKIVP